MKLLVVTQYFWPEDFRINELVTDLCDRGHEVTVLTGVPNYPSGKPFAGYRAAQIRRERYGRAEVVRVPMLPRGKARGARLALNYLSFACSAAVLGPWLCRGRFDSILVFEPSPITVGIPAAVLRLVKRAPVAFWVQDLWPESLVATGAVKSQAVVRAMGKLVRFVYRHSDLILAQSRGFIPSIERLAPRGRKTLYFPNSAEKLYRPLEPKELGGVKLPQGFVLIFAGNIGAAQDFPTLLGAAELLRERKDIHWVIIGDGRERPWVASEVTRRDLGETVHLLGRYPMEEMPKFFSHADALLVSLKKEPIFALTITGKVQSYLACAKPILAALEGEGARVIGESGAGIACPPEDPAQLARAVVQMAALSPEDRRRMGESGRRYFEENFDSQRLVTQLEGWLEALGRGAEVMSS